MSDEEERSIVIGIVGPAGAGKSTVAAYLAEKYRAKRYSLAGPLKEVAKRTLGFTDEQLYGTQEQKEAIDPRYGFSCRTFLQKLGTEGCRAVFGPDFWTRMLVNQILKERPRLAVIDDMRFVSEAEMVQFHPELNGIIWRLHPVGDDESAARAAAAGLHASEREWLEVEADDEIHPPTRGIELLKACVDECADFREIDR